jgi:F-type H+-transporting ATPase subunit b
MDWHEAHFWELVGLIVFLAALVWLKVPGMALNALDSRAKKIQAQLDEANKLRQEAQALLADIQTQREASERQAAEVLAAAKAEAERLGVELKAKLEEQIKRRGELAERRIALAEAQAAAEVKAAAVDLAARAAETVLAARLAGAAADPLVDQALAGLPAKLQ